MNYKTAQILRGAEIIKKNSIANETQTNEVARLREQGKVFVDPKWIYDLETQLAKAHEELCQAGLREYGV